MYKQYHNLCLLYLITATCTWVLMTSPAVLSSDHSSSKASSVLLIAMSSIVAGQHTATVPSLSPVSMSSSKVFHSSTFAMSSSSFVALSSSMATPPLPLGSSKLVSSLPVVSKSVARLSRPSRSESSPVAMSSSWAFEQGTSVLPSVSSWLLLSSAVSLSSLHQSHLSFVVVSTTLAIDKSTPETPSPSSMLLASSTVVSKQSGTLFSDDLFEIQRTLQSNLHVRPSLLQTTSSSNRPCISKLPKFSQSEPYKNDHPL